MKQQRPQNQPLPPRLTRRRRRFRRAFAFGGIVLFIALVVVGVQGWRIVSALVEAERSVVVPLPTRSSGVELGGAANSGAEKPAITPEYLITPSAEANGPDGTSQPESGNQAAAVITPPATSAALPNVTVVPTPTVTAATSASAMSSAIASAPTSTAQPTATPKATQTSASSAAENSTPEDAPNETVVTAASVPTASPEVLMSDGTGGPEMSTPVASPTGTIEARATTPPPATVTPTAEVTSAPAAETAEPLTPTPVQTPTATPTANGSDVAVSSVSSPADAAAASTVPAAAVEGSPIAGASDQGGGDGGDPSHLDIVRQVLGQGFDGGDPATSDVWKGKTSLTILVVGLDRRADGGDQNADVIIIAQLDLTNRTMRAVSVPRDLLVEIPGVGYDKINSAYNHGILEDPNNPAAGVSKVRDTVEYNFGVPIDDYVLVDFDGFVEVVDAVGGIQVDVPYDILDEEYPTEDYGIETVFFPAGSTEMDGATALKYVRTRHADSDDQRRERQLQVLLAIFAKGKSIGSLTRIDNMILALGDSAQTSFPLDQQLTLARLALEMDSNSITLSSLAPPLITGGIIDTGAWVYSGDMGQIAAFIQDAVYGPDGAPSS